MLFFQETGLLVLGCFRDKVHENYRVQLELRCVKETHTINSPNFFNKCLEPETASQPYSEINGSQILTNEKSI